MPTYPARATIVSILVATALIVLTQLYLAVPLLIPVGAEFGIEPTFALSASFSLCYALGFVVWGPLADHYGRRRILLIGMSLLIIATATCTFAHTPAVLALARSIQGATAASFAPVALAYLSEATEPKRRALAIGTMSTAFLVAGIFGQVSAQVISGQFGWRAVFIASATTLVACALSIAASMRENPREATSVKLFLNPNKNLMLLCGAHITLLLAFVAIYTALQDDRTPHELLILRLIGLPGMFACLAVGPLSKRFHMKHLARAGFSISACGIALLSFATPPAILLFVTGVAIAVPSMITLFGQAAAPHRATGMALNGLVLFLGASLGAFVPSLAPSFTILLVILVTLHVFAALCLTFVDRTLAQ